MGSFYNLTYIPFYKTFYKFFRDSTEQKRTDQDKAEHLYRLYDCFTETITKSSGQIRALADAFREDALSAIYTNKPLFFKGFFFS